jgi:hypothetical protein
LGARSGPRTRRIVAELVVVAAAVALLAGACALDLEWLKRRFALERTAVFVGERAALAAAGIALLVLGRARAGRWAERVSGVEALAASFRLCVAIALAIVASEVSLRILRLPRRYEMGVTSDCLGEMSARYGWLFKASRSFTIETAGRPITYDFDAAHDRARSPADAPDPERPTILFVGESITAGHGLNWDESFPAIVGEALGVQVVNLGVEGYGVDQAFLRLLEALPRFARPVAIVTVFLPLMVGRVQRVDHPRLVFEGVEPKLVPPGFVQSLRLTQVLRESLGFQAEWAIESTQEVFRRTVKLANERMARAVFVTPYLETEWPRRDGYLIDELLVRQGFTVVDPRFGFEPISRDDRHPDAASTRRLAEAVILALRSELAAR